MDILTNLLRAHEAKDWIKCKPLMGALCEQISLIKLIEKVESSMGAEFAYSLAMRYFDIFNRTNLCNEPDGTLCREQSIDITSYVIQHAPPELKKVLDDGFKKFFPELQPSGYDSNGRPVYSAKAASEALGVSEDKVIEFLKGREGMIFDDDVYTVQ